MSLQGILEVSTIKSDRICQQSARLIQNCEQTATVRHCGVGAGFEKAATAIPPNGNSVPNGPRSANGIDAGAFASSRSRSATAALCVLRRVAHWMRSSIRMGWRLRVAGDRGRGLLKVLRGAHARVTAALSGAGREQRVADGVGQAMVGSGLGRGLRGGWPTAHEAGTPGAQGPRSPSCRATSSRGASSWAGRLWSTPGGSARKSSITQTNLPSGSRH